MSLADEIVSALHLAIKQDKLTLPTLPKVALMAKEKAEDPDASFSDLADVISADASICARIIKIVNCPLMRSNKPIDNIHDATGRLGLNYTSNLVIGLAMEQMFTSDHEIINKKLDEIWQHSIQIAATAYVYAQNYTKLSADKSMLAGLVHKIGALPILTLLSERADLATIKTTLDPIIQQIHGTVGLEILKSWDFPSDLIELPLHYNDIERNHEGIDYIDVVTASHIVNTHKSNQGFTAPIPCLQKMGILDDFLDVRTKNMTKVNDTASLLLM